MRGKRRFGLRDAARTLLGGSCAAAAALFFAAFPFSCKLTEEGIEIDSGDLSAPSLVSFTVKSSTCAEIVCSERFSISGVTLLDDEREASFVIGSEAVSFGSGGLSCEISFPEPTEVGKNYVLSAIVADASGNSLELSKEFIGFNDNPARLMISEIRCAYSKNTSSLLRSRADFVELYALEGGNLAGTELWFGYNKKKYVFPCIDVGEGETIVVHLKSFGEESDGFCDELEGDLSLSTGFESNDAARDLWVRGTSSYVSKTSDVVALVDSYTARATDGIMFAQSGKSFSRTNQKELAALLASSAVWESADISTAASADGATATKSLARKNAAALIAQYAGNAPRALRSCAADWEISASTPGEIP